MLPSLPVSANQGSSRLIALPRIQPATGMFLSACYRVESKRSSVDLRPICPQPKGKTVEEELFAFSGAEPPMQNLKQIESECLNLNITCPGGLTRESHLPVMVWIHGCALPRAHSSRVDL
jgi:carboxylesterase type B